MAGFQDSVGGNIIGRQRRQEPAPPFFSTEARQSLVQEPVLYAPVITEPPREPDVPRRQLPRLGPQQNARADA